MMCRETNCLPGGPGASRYITSRAGAMAASALKKLVSLMNRV